jgi:TolB-like protein
VLSAVLGFAALKSGRRTREVEPSVAGVAPHSIFVLPFRNAGTNAADRELRGRVTNALIDSLTLVSGVAVGPRNSGWVARDEEELRRSLARTNAMRHVLTGRLGTAGDYQSVLIDSMRLAQRALALDPGYLDADQFDACCFRFTASREKLELIRSVAMTESLARLNVPSP